MRPRFDLSTFAPCAVRVALLCCAPLLLAQSCVSSPAPTPPQDQTTPDTSTPDTTDPGPAAPGSSGVPVGVERAVANEGNQHVPIGTQVQYASNPPASGPHWSGLNAPIAPGVYADRVEEEQWVHNLEHGYAVVLYDCAGPCSQNLLDSLQSLYDAAPLSSRFQKKKLVITPHSPLPHPVMAVAWDVQMSLDAVDEAALLAFYGRHLDQGPELAP